MKLLRIRIFVWTIIGLLSAAVLCGCGSDGKETVAAASKSSKTKGTRDNTPQLRTPVADGIVTYGNEAVTIDASHTEDGYLMVIYLGDSRKVKLQIKASDQTTYTYDLSPGADYDIFPLSAGDGIYEVGIYENITADKYSTAFFQEIDVKLKDEYTPFLYPNQYVDYNAEAKSVQKAAVLAEYADTDLDVVSEIYNYVTKNIAYDEKKAKEASSGGLSGYLPNVDETLASGKGICFDYAALMTCMLRTQGIPTKLEIGLSGETKHAWISTYLKENGWIDNIIEFDGKSWKLMDPTFAASGKNSKKIQKYIGDGSNYTLQYSR